MRGERQWGRQHTYYLKDRPSKKSFLERSRSAMQKSDPLVSNKTINDCVESIEGELRETLYIHDVQISRTVLAHLQTLDSLTEGCATPLRLATKELQSFLEERLGRVPISCDRNRIVLLLDSLRRQANPPPNETFPESSSAEVRAAGRQFPKQPTCLFLDSQAVSLLLDEVSSAAGHCVENICGLSNVEVNAQNDAPLTIIADLSTLRDDALARRKVQRLRDAHPRTQVFCLSSATHFSARLEAVRLGASRYLIKQFDVDQLIAILDGIATRKENRRFRGLLVDNGNALAALHAHTVCAAARNIDGRKTALYADLIARDIYMTGCKSLQRTVGQQPPAPSPCKTSPARQPEHKEPA